jgi:hypothetical protein
VERRSTWRSDMIPARWWWWAAADSPGDIRSDTSLLIATGLGAMRSIMRTQIEPVRGISKGRGRVEWAVMKLCTAAEFLRTVRWDGRLSRVMNRVAEQAATSADRA